MTTATPTVQAHDLLPVRGRVSWGAILAGATLALALYFLLALLGGAVGLSVGDKVTDRTLAASAAVYAALTTAVCLFAGGWVASLLTAGEDREEGCLYGILVWAVVFAVLLHSLTAGVRLGLSGVAHAAAAGHALAEGTTPADWEAAARQAGVPQDKVDEWKKAAPAAPAAAKQAVDDPATQQAAATAATRASWYAFLGAWVSMMAACAGGYFGTGPTIRVVPAGRVAIPAQ